MKTARGNYPNGSIKHRRFAIRPRLAYFPRVRSPLRGLYQPPRRLSLGLHLRRALQRPTWPPRGRRRKAPNVAGAGWRFAPEKSRLRGDEYRPRARARACVHDALPSQNYGQRRLNLSAPNADRSKLPFLHAGDWRRNFKWEQMWSAWGSYLLIRLWEKLLL